MEARRNNNGKPKFSLIRLSCLEPLARVLDYGRDKYSDFIGLGNDKIYKGWMLSRDDINNKDLFGRVYDARSNWDNGLLLSETLDSLQRHIAELQDGNYLDSESGLSHIGHIQANAMFLGSKNLIDDITKKDEQ